MSNQEVGECGNRLQYLFEVLHVIRKANRDRFPEIEVELSRVLAGCGKTHSKPLGK
jgi:hypothetical protein